VTDVAELVRLSWTKIAAEIALDH